MIKTICVFGITKQQNLLCRNFSKVKSAKPRQKISKVNHDSLKVSSDTGPEQIFTHLTAGKYYKLNLCILAGYALISSSALLNKDYPDYLKTTISTFTSISVAGIVGILMFSSRHIKSITLWPKQNLLEFNTYNYLVRNPKPYKLNITEIKEIVPFSKYFYLKNTSLFIVKPETLCFKRFNFFVVRPNNTNYKFDEIFSPKLKK